MNFEKVQRRKRKAISPVLATVILIAITLIAAIAIAGFVFGLFGSFTSTANISQLSVNVPHAVAGAGLAFTCSGTATSPYIGLSNTGTANANVLTLSLTFGGSTYTAAPTGACAVSAGATQYLTITAYPAAASATGQAFTGSVSMSNSGAVPIAGTFS